MIKLSSCSLGQENITSKTRKSIIVRVLSIKPNMSEFQKSNGNVCLGSAQMEYPGAPLEVVHFDPLTSRPKLQFHVDNSVCYPSSLRQIFCEVGEQTILQLSAKWPGLWMAGRLEMTLLGYRPHCFCCVKKVVLMLTRCIFMTKAARSVSKQGHLQPHCHSKDRSLSRQL